MEKGISKAQWIDQVRRELKDRKRGQDLNWMVDEGLEVEPFYHPDDQIIPIGPIPWRGSNHWQVAVWNKWPVEQEWMENQIRSGAECIIIECLAEYVSVTRAIKELSLVQPIQFHLSLLTTDHEHLESADNITIRSGSHLSVSQLFEISTDVDGYINQMVDLLEKLLKTPEKNRSVLMIPIGDIFLAEIAKIRALQVIILNLWNQLKLDLKLLPEIECHIHPKPGMDPYSDLISKTSRAVPGILAGCDRLVLHRHDGNELLEYLDVNIHHILSHEGWLDKVQDPLAGSFSVDRITHLFVEHSWRRLKETGAGQIESK